MPTRAAKEYNPTSTPSHRQSWDERPGRACRLDDDVGAASVERLHDGVGRLVRGVEHQVHAEPLRSITALWDELEPDQGKRSVQLG